MPDSFRILKVYPSSIAVERIQRGRSFPWRGVVILAATLIAAAGIIAVAIGGL